MEDAHAKGPTKDNAWVVRYARRPRARLHLFCVPYAGGGASMFRTWSQSLAEDVEVCAVQLPGRENRIREAPLSDFNAVVDRLARALRPEICGPFVLFGHSIGALLAFEVARLLQNGDGLVPAHFFASGHNAPQLPLEICELARLDDASLLEKVQELNGTPREVLEHPELRQLLLPILRADFALCDTYRYTRGQPLNCAISAFGGLEDPHVNRSGLQAWREQTTVGCTVQMFPGDHFFLIRDQALVLRAIGDTLSACLGQPRGE